MKLLDVYKTAAQSHAAFFVSLPMEAPSPAEFVPASCVKRPTVLLVDDDPDILCITRALLELEGYRVVSSSSPGGAVDLFGRLDCVDLLITDYQMPERSGLELARELTSARPTLPVLVVSGSILTEPMESEIRERQWRFVAKPWRLSELLSLIEVALS